MNGYTTPVTTPTTPTKSRGRPPDLWLPKSESGSTVYQRHTPFERIEQPFPDPEFIRPESLQACQAVPFFPLDGNGQPFYPRQRVVDQADNHRWSHYRPYFSPTYLLTRCRCAAYIMSRLVRG